MKRKTHILVILSLKYQQNACLMNVEYEKGQKVT